MTQTPVTIDKVRAGRKKPGLLRQHLCAVNAAAAVCHGRAEGASLGSSRVVLEPNAVFPGEYRFSVGSAGSATLVLQTVIPPLLKASGPSRVVVEGGTHNPSAPPFEYLDRVYGASLRSMGAGLTFRLERAGFYPNGGGRIVAEIEPGGGGPFERIQRGPLRGRRATIIAAGLPSHVAQREAAELENVLEDVQIEVVEPPAMGTGNVVLVELDFEGAPAMFVGFGARGKRAESVAGDAARSARAFERSAAAVDAHLADQLLLPLAVGAGGAFSTGPLTRHARTNMMVLQQFLPVSFDVADEGDAGPTQVRVTANDKNEEQAQQPPGA